MNTQDVLRTDRTNFSHVLVSPTSIVPGIVKKNSKVKIACKVKKKTKQKSKTNKKKEACGLKIISTVKQPSKFAL